MYTKIITNSLFKKKINMHSTKLNHSFGGFGGFSVSLSGELLYTSCKIGYILFVFW